MHENYEDLGVHVPEEDIRPTLDLSQVTYQINALTIINPSLLNSNALRILHSIHRYKHLQSLYCPDYVVDVGCAYGIGLSAMTANTKLGIDFNNSCLEAIRQYFPRTFTMRKDINELTTDDIPITGYNGLITFLELVGTYTIKDDVKTLQTLVNTGLSVAISVPNYRGYTPKAYYSNLYNAERFKNLLLSTSPGVIDLYSQSYPTKNRKTFLDGLDEDYDFFIGVVRK